MVEDQEEGHNVEDKLSQQHYVTLNHAGERSNSEH